MFGYVIPPLQVLSKEEAERFRHMYCGLCHTLGERYGQVARFILNYDFTFLAILLESPEGGDSRDGRCAVKGFRKSPYRVTDEAMELAADESVILAYWQLRDGIADHAWLHGMKYRTGAAVLEQAYRKAAAYRPAFDIAVRKQLKALKRLEEDGCASIDRAADTFATLLESAAQEVDDPVRRRVLKQILYHLGRWVYLVDAADDLKKDLASGNYNPVALRYSLENGEWTKEARQAFSATLDHSIHMMTTAFELWEFGEWKSILETTLYSGLFQVGRAVLDGTFQRGQNRDGRKNSKKVEETT